MKYLPQTTYPCKIGITTNINDILNFAKKHKVEINNPSMEGCYAKTYAMPPYFIIGLNPLYFNKKLTTQLQSVIVHESVHIWQYIKEFIGEDKPGEETEAYFLQWLFHLTCETYVKHFIKPIKKKI